MKKLFLSSLFLCLFFTTIPAHAQQLSPRDFVQDIREGRLNLSDAASVIENATDFDIAQATEFVDNLRRITDLDAAGELLGDLLTGQISEAIASELSELINLGNLESLSDITQILENLDVNANLEEFLEGMDLGELEGFVENITQLAGGIEALENMATEFASEALAEVLEDIAPELIEALGGAEAVANIVNQALGGTGITPSVVGSPVSGDDGAHSCCQCQRPISINHRRIRTHVTNEFNAYRYWFTNDMFKQNILPAWQLMTSELTIAGMQQVSIIGQFFDAKHQLETQALFQQLTAEAHKDYQPSEGLCSFGTNMRSLASSERKADLTHRTLAAGGMQRQLSTGDGISVGGIRSDKESRIKNFIKNHCDPSDNGNGFDRFCLGTTSTPERRNKDVNFTQTVETKLTLDLDFTDGTSTADEEDVMALQNNLFAHDILPNIAEHILADGSGTPNQAANNLLALRSIAAKRSVAQNSVHAITALKTSGEAGSAPYMYRLMADLGVRNTELRDLLGENPSYFAQMEVLTKNIYQNPSFYTDLYDKPVNVERKGAVLQAIGLMQDRDSFDSLMRSEAALATLLETLLQREHRSISGKLRDIDSDGEVQ